VVAAACKEIRMSESILTGPDGWTLLKIAAALVPTVTFIWIIATVTALHRRGVYFWGLGSTWTTIIGCPIGLLIASMGSWGGLSDPNAAPFYTPIAGGLILYVVVLAYSILYNFGATKSVILALSTALLQQLALLCVILLLLRWSGDRTNSGRRARRSLTGPVRVGAAPTRWRR
jgi:hypothetical protein